MLDPYIMELFMDPGSQNPEVTQIAALLVKHNLEISQFCVQEKENCSVQPTRKYIRKRKIHNQKKLSRSSSFNSQASAVKRLKNTNSSRTSDHFITNCSDEVYLKRFAMSRDKMQAFISYVSKKLKENQVAFNSSKISLANKIHIFVHVLTTTESFRQIAMKFGLNATTVFYVFRQIEGIIAELKEDLIKWPDFEEQTVIKREVYNKHRFPNCVGFIDWYPIYNRQKNKFLISLQGVSDHNLLFQHVFLHESFTPREVFKMSNLNMNLKDLIKDQDHLLGSSSYPLQINLMTPYTKENKTDCIKNYNKIHESTQAYIKAAFKKLISTFHRLTDLQVVSSHNDNIVLAACVLHNFVLKAERKFTEEDLNTLQFGKGLRPADKRNLICDTLAIST